MDFLDINQISYDLVYGLQLLTLKTVHFCRRYISLQCQKETEKRKIAINSIRFNV